MSSLLTNVSVAGRGAAAAVSALESAFSVLQVGASYVVQLEYYSDGSGDELLTSKFLGFRTCAYGVLTPSSERGVNTALEKGGWIGLEFSDFSVEWNVFTGESAPRVLRCA